MRTMRGAGLAEVLVVVFVVSLVALAAAPAVEHLRGAGRGAAGARVLVGLFREARMEAVARRRSHGYWFDLGPRGWRFRKVVDGNGNGLRTAEVRAGTDKTVRPPVYLQDVVARVRPGFPAAGPYRQPPPMNGPIPGVDDPIRFGRSDLVSFSPLGRSSSGTVYLDDGAGGLWAVVVFGPAVRLRVWRWDPRAGVWRAE